MLIFTNTSKVALKALVDNFAVLAIEHCVIENIPTIFTPDVAMNLDEKVLRNIAAQSTGSKAERDRTSAKLKSLELGLQTLNRLAHHKITGKPHLL